MATPNSDEIRDSRLVYDPRWLSGKMEHRAALEPLRPSMLLLLCLRSNIFAKADGALMKAMCSQLRIFEAIKAAMGEWELEKHYPLVRNYSALEKRMRTVFLSYNALLYVSLDCRL